MVTQKKLFDVQSPNLANFFILISALFFGNILKYTLIATAFPFTYSMNFMMNNLQKKKGESEATF